MQMFYGLHNNGLWYITDKEPGYTSYIVIVAPNKQDAERQLFEMIGLYNPRIYL